jgi:hypothetical protein
MPAVRMNVKVEQKGTIFNASATKAAGQRMTTRVNDLLAQEGVRRVKDRLDVVLQNPTGFYRSRIQVDRRSQYRGISDGGVVYGGWLEGVDSRNRTTRFKGYRTFRIVKQSIDRDKETLVAPVIAQYVRELNQ